MTAEVDIDDDVLSIVERSVDVNAARIAGVAVSRRAFFLVLIGVLGECCCSSKVDVDGGGTVGGGGGGGTGNGVCVDDV